MADSLELLTTEEAARMLAVKPSLLERWRVEGGGPRFVRYGRRTVRYRASDLDAWVRARVVASTSEADERELRARGR